jgi:hypothetical protein
MASPAIETINRSLFLSGVVSKEFETPSGDQVNNGLVLLNSLLAMNGSDLELIPYFKRDDFLFVVNQEEYFIENLLQVQALTFNIGPVRYPMEPVGRDRYFGSGRVDNISSLPFQYHTEREKGGLRIWVYYLPDQAYVGKISGKYALDQVPSLQYDLSLVYDDFYIEYLRYALSNYMCQEYDLTFHPNKLKMLEKMQKRIAYVEPPDMRMRKTQIVSARNNNLTWAQVNIGRGYTPS